MKVVAKIVSLCLLLFCRFAYACPDGQHEECVPFTGICACFPNAPIPNPLPALNPLPDTLNVLGGVIHGNINQISQGVGGLIVKGTCPGCAIAASTVMNSNDKAFVETLIGRGWLLYVSGVDPSLIVVDAATSIATRIDLHNSSPQMMPATPPMGRTKKRFSAADALCIVVEDASRKATAGWVNAPSLVDATTGIAATYPQVDLYAGDEIIVNAPDVSQCAVPPAGQTRLTSITMSYSWSSSIPGGPTAMKYFLIGDKSTP